MDVLLRGDWNQILHIVHGSSVIDTCVPVSLSHSSAVFEDKDFVWHMNLRIMILGHCFTQPRLNFLHLKREYQSLLQGFCKNLVALYQRVHGVRVYHERDDRPVMRGCWDGGWPPPRTAGLLCVWKRMGRRRMEWGRRGALLARGRRLHLMSVPDSSLLLWKIPQSKAT